MLKCKLQGSERETKDLWIKSGWRFGELFHPSLLRSNLMTPRDHARYVLLSFNWKSCNFFFFFSKIMP